MTVEGYTICPVCFNWYTRTTQALTQGHQVRGAPWAPLCPGSWVPLATPARKEPES